MFAAACQFGIVAACSVALWHLTNPLYWILVAILQGFTFFNMTTLLHDVVHNLVFWTRRPRWERALGLAYAIASGISASQFTRWYKLLYRTPVLMPIYLRAAAREAAWYPEDLRRLIRRERTATIVIQLSVMAALAYFGGLGRVLRIQVVPYFLVFPVAFTLNRLGQHDNIDPRHPLTWSTSMSASRLWDSLFRYWNYHLEHHYFPRVPFYNLRRLHMRLRPLYDRLGLRVHTYRDIVWQWFVLNRAPHTDWEVARATTGPGSPEERRESRSSGEVESPTGRVAARVTTP